MKPLVRLLPELELPPDARTVTVAPYIFDADQLDTISDAIKGIPNLKLWLCSGVPVLTLALDGFTVKTDAEQYQLGEMLWAKWLLPQLPVIEPPPTCGPVPLEGAELLSSTEGRLSPADLPCDDYRQAMVEIGIQTLKTPVTDPHALAKRHIKRYTVDGHRTSANMGEELLIWDGSIWKQTTDKQMAPYLTETIKQAVDEHAMQVQANGGCGALRPVKRSLVGDTLNALKSLSKTPERPAPFWLNDHPWAVDDVIPFRNGLLHWPSYLDGSGYFISPTPAFFNRHCLGFDFDPGAPKPTRWQQFLDELWDETACHDLLHEWGGYCMTYDTSAQKLMMLLGSPRGGKGTVAWVLRQMVGDNVASPTFKSLIGEFGLAPLLGKQLAIFPDTRKVSDKVLHDACAILKAITGEDPMTVNIKNRQQVTEQLELKIIIQSNETLAIPDNSAAMHARQLFLSFTQSFVGREDFQLKQKLLPELPGIANLFLEGLRRLRANGGVFTEPESSRALSNQVRYAAIPLSGFVETVCFVDRKSAILVDELYATYCRWAGENDCPVVDRADFGKELREVVRSVNRTQSVGGYQIALSKFKTTALRPYYYTGIRLTG